MSYVVARPQKSLGVVPGGQNLWLGLALSVVLLYVFRAELFGGVSTAGWYVELYEYPVGHRERRIKLVEGPFESKREANEVARENDDVWYPRVVYRERAYTEEDF
jgi:hypothetical protein